MGLVRAMARSDHWRWVSMPRWVRGSWKILPCTGYGVTSNCQRNTNHSRIWVGFADGSVRRRAWGSKAPSGSLTSTQRTVTAGLLQRYQTAVWEVSSTVRVVPSYQDTAATVHGTSAWSMRVFSEGLCWPLGGVGGIVAQLAAQPVHPIPQRRANVPAFVDMPAGLAQARPALPHPRGLSPVVPGLVPGIVRGTVSTALIGAVGSRNWEPAGNLGAIREK